MIVIKVKVKLFRRNCTVSNLKGMIRNLFLLVKFIEWAENDGSEGANSPIPYFNQSNKFIKFSRLDFYWVRFGGAEWRAGIGTWS